MSSIINDVIKEVIDMASDYSIRIGDLPADGGISIYYGAGFPFTTFQTKGMSYELDLTLNAKGIDQEAVSDALNNIHQLLTQTKEYPDSDEFQINDIITTDTPHYADLEENGQWLYGSSLRVRFFYKKGSES